MTRWTEYFLDLCDLNASMSKDPSTKVGAVIARPDRTVASMGWNGFARGTSDDPAIYVDRPRKYARTVHAELNAILSCRDLGMEGYTLYVSPLHPCCQCAAAIIQAGIAEVIYRTPEIEGEAEARWEDSFREARQLFGEAGVTVVGITKR